MVKLIWLSDLHFVCSGSRVLNHDATARLSAAIGEINTHHDDAAMCIISGDLVDRGGVAEYRELRSHLDHLRIPWVPMVGNHDNRDLLIAELCPAHLDRDSAFVQYAHKVEAGLIVCIDTLKVGSDAGEYCAQRYEWLENTLANANGAPTYVFMHHPPLPLGLPMQDTDRLVDGERLLAFLQTNSELRHLFIGHVHRPIAGSLRGTAFTTMRSCLYQAPPPWPDWTWDTFAPAREAPNMGVVYLDGENVFMHYHQFTEYAVGIA